MNTCLDHIFYTMSDYEQTLMLEIRPFKSDQSNKVVCVWGTINHKNTLYIILEYGLDIFQPHKTN